MRLRGGTRRPSFVSVPMTTSSIIRGSRISTRTLLAQHWRTGRGKTSRDFLNKIASQTRVFALGKFPFERPGTPGMNPRPLPPGGSGSFGEGGKGSSLLRLAHQPETALPGEYIRFSFVFVLAAAIQGRDARV